MRKQKAGRDKISKIEKSIEKDKIDQIKDEERELNKIEKENLKQEKEEELNQTIKNRLYPNSFDKVIINVIKGKDEVVKFNNDENQTIANNIITKYKLLSNAYFNNKQISDKETDNYAEYNGIINNIKDLKNDTQIDKLLKIKLNDKEKQLISYYETNDRKDIINVLNNELFNNAKKIIKTIYYPKKSSVDIIAFEDIFKDNVEYATNFYNMIKEELMIKQSNYDDKIKYLLESKIIIPIVNDFMWIDNKNEIYHVENNNKKESEEKLYYILNKITNLTNKLESNDNSTIPDHLKYKNGFYYSSEENNDIIKENLFTSNQIIKSQIQLLINHQQNPYFNLKAEHYFNYHFNRTLTAIRYISIKEKKNKFINKNQKIQLRTSANDNFNIVGFMIFDGKTDEIKYDDLEEINYNKFLDCVKDKLNDKRFTGGYWLFNEKDKIRINFNDNMDNSIVCKMLTELLFDDVNNIHKDIIIKRIKKATSYYEVMDIIRDEINKFYHNQVNNYSINSDLFSHDTEDINFIDFKLQQIEEGIYQFLTINNKDLENKYDELYGYENAIKLKDPNITLKQNKIDIDLTNEKYIEDNTINIYEGLTCQHHISWDDINESFKHKDSNYQNLLNGFISKYVEIDIHGKYICKSCSEPINIENYVQELNKVDNKLIVTSSVFIGRIEDDKRYKEFIGVNGVINGIRNSIIKISDLVNIPQYMVRSRQTENDINQVTKDTIDLLQNTLSLWANKYLEYNNTKEDKFNISRILSDLFIWPFDNDLFNNKTQYRDINKLNKQNNAVLYVSINLINSLSKDQIMNLTKNKECNFTTYETLIKHIGNVKMQITKEQITPIANYPVLGYVIFNFAFNLVRYNQYVDLKGREKNNKLIMELIIRAFYTIIDIMNIINIIYFEVKETNNNSELFNFYQRYYLNFLQHLNFIYSDSSIIPSLRFDKNKSIEKTEYENNEVKVSGKYQDYFNESKFIKNNDRIKYYQQFNCSFSNKEYDNKVLRYDDIRLNKYLCCRDGRIHKWINDNKGIKCKLCNITYEELLKQKDNISNNIKNEFLQELAKRYCFTAKKHSFVLKDNKRICSLCGYVDGSKLSNDKLLKLKDNFYVTHIINDEVNKDNIEVKIIDDDVLLDKEFNILKDNIQKDNDQIEESGIIINPDVISYTINYDYNGKKIDPKVLSKEQVLESTLNNKKVLYYRENNINIYYDPITLKYLGYKSRDNFIEYKGIIDNRLVINYDIKTFLNNLFITPEINNVLYLSKKDILNTYYNNICLFMNNLNKIINKINNNIDKVNKTKINDFNTYLDNRNIVLDMIALSYSGNSTFKIDNKFNEILAISYQSIINNKLFDDQLIPNDKTMKIFKEYEFIPFKNFSMLILLKAINSLMSIDSKISKQIIKLMIYTYLSNYQLDKSTEISEFIDISYAPLYVYGDTVNYEINYETDESDNESEEIEDIDVDKFRDVDEDGNLIENDSDDEIGDID